MSHEVEHHIHESPKSMTVPLVILAVFSLTAGWLELAASLGGSDRFEKFLDPVFAKEAQFCGRRQGRAARRRRERGGTHQPSRILLMFLSVAAAGMGWFMARRAYVNADKGYTEPIAAPRRPSTTFC